MLKSIPNRFEIFFRLNHHNGLIKSYSFINEKNKLKKAGFNMFSF